MAIEKTNIKDIIDKNYAEFDLGLLCEDKYKSLKHIDMVVYTLLNNQHGLSVKTTLNGSKRFVDKNGYVFISIGQDKLCKLLRTTRPTLNASLKRLEEVGLVEVVNTGNMKCNRIYVGKLKRTITLGDYMKDMNISSEENEFIPSIDIETIEEIKENKKASTGGTVKANESNTNKNIDTNIIPQNNKKYSSKNKENKNSKPNRFHNCRNKVLEYTRDELDEILKENEKRKKIKKEQTELKEKDCGIDNINIQEYVKNSIMNAEYFKKLEDEYKIMVIDYIDMNKVFKIFSIHN